MLPYKNKQKIEICIDEAGRGCMAGPVYASAVVWSPTVDSTGIRDSKKLSKKKRKEKEQFIRENSIAYGIGSSSAAEIDKYNILEATYIAMHRAVDEVIKKLNLKEKDYDRTVLLVDGKWFKPYWTEYGWIEHECIIKGDDTYIGIAAASILAKVNHDKHIENICKQFPNDVAVYKWEKNMCYGTAEHINAIKENGISQFHRKTFGICANY